MQLLFLSSIPPTRIFSYIEYCQLQKGKRKEYILSLLAAVPAGLTCRQIHEISGIEIQSLTCPLKELEETGMIKVSGTRKSDRTARHNQIYILNDN